MLRNSRTLLLILTLLLALGGRSLAACDDIELLGIIGAMDIETSFLVDNMLGVVETTLAGRIFRTGTIEGFPVVVVTGGIGKVNAAMSTQLLFTKFEVSAVIMTGVAGGLGKEAKAGDMLIATKVVQHDYRRVGENKVVPGRLKVATGKGWKVYKAFACDDGLVEMFVEAASRTDFDGRTPLSTERPNIACGVIASGDQFIHSRKLHEWIEHTYDAKACDMETGAVGQVCVTFKRPFAAIRALSDTANSWSTASYHVNKKRAARHAQQVLLNLLYDLARARAQ